jgi:hypothetical protein
LGACFNFRTSLVVKRSPKIELNQDLIYSGTGC